LLTGDAAYSSVHLTHLIDEIVKMITKVSLYPLKLLASRVTSAVEKGVKVEGAGKEGGIAEAAGSFVSTRSHFG